MLRKFEVTWPEDRSLGRLEIEVVDDAGESVYSNAQPNAAFLERPHEVRMRLAVGRYVVTCTTHSGLKGSVPFEVPDLEPTDEVIHVEMR